MGDAVADPGLEQACGAGAAAVMAEAADRSMVDQLKALTEGGAETTDAVNRQIDDLAETARHLKLSRHLGIFPGAPGAGGFSGDVPFGDNGEAHSGEDIPQWLHEAASQVDPNEWAFPFRNLVMEGGGAKGLAYCGVLEYLEEVGVAGKLRRFGGASAGAISAAMMALGYTSNELKGFMINELPSLSKDLVYPDFSGVMSIFRLVRALMKSNGGLNPGKEFHDWFGDKIKAKSLNNNPDMTFFDLFREQDGTELLVVVANLNLSTAQICHPKTTPDLPIRDALRASMAIPFFFEPWQMGNQVYNDWFVDGGLLNNFPIFGFDGWYLSMKPENSFTSKLNLDDLRDSFRSAFDHGMLNGMPNFKTLGCMLYEDQERDSMKYYLMQRKGVNLPEETKSNDGKDELEKDIEEHKELVKAVKHFASLLEKHKNLEEDNQITVKQLNAVLDEKELTASELDLLFKETDKDKIIESLKINDGRISYMQLMSVMEKRGAKLVDSLLGYGRRKVTNTFTSIGQAVMDATSLTITDQHIQKGDIGRTMGVATGCVGTFDFSATPQQVEFVTQRGRNAAKAFLKYFVAEHKDNPNKIVQKKGEEEKSTGA